MNSESDSLCILFISLWTSDKGGQTKLLVKVIHYVYYLSLYGLVTRGGRPKLLVKVIHYVYYLSLYGLVTRVGRPSC